MFGLGREGFQIECGAATSVSDGRQASEASLSLEMCARC